MKQTDKTIEALDKAVSCAGHARFQVETSGYKDLSELAHAARKTLEFVEEEFKRRAAPRSAREIISDLDRDQHVP